MSETLPKITIITPSYNQAKYLDQTIKSIISQKYPNLQYIIMDGGSTDDSVKIIKKYAKKYPQIITWQSKKDKGQTDAINQGLKQATGEIIAYINSDDYYTPGTFRKVVKFFQSHSDKQWVVGNCKVTQRNLRWTFALKHLWPIDKFPIALHTFNAINQPAVFWTNKLHKKVGNFNEKYRYAFDYEYWLRCEKKLGLPGRIKSNLAVFRVHKDAKGSTAYLKQFTEDYEISKQFSTNFLAVFSHFLSKHFIIFSYKFLK